MHVTLRQLRYFVEAADAGSMTAAAQALNVAPTALSLQIKALEEHFGRAVFVRRSNGISLTDDGHTLIGYARRILDLVEAEGQKGAAQPEAMSLAALSQARADVRAVHLAPELRDYIVRLVDATRSGSFVKDIEHAVSPRGTLPLAASSPLRTAAPPACR